MFLHVLHTSVITPYVSYHWQIRYIKYIADHLWVEWFNVRSAFLNVMKRQGQRCKQSQGLFHLNVILAINTFKFHKLAPIIN